MLDARTALSAFHTRPLVPGELERMLDEPLIERLLEQPTVEQPKVPSTPAKPCPPEQGRGYRGAHRAPAPYFRRLLRVGRWTWWV